VETRLTIRTRIALKDKQMAATEWHGSWLLSHKEQVQISHQQLGNELIFFVSQQPFILETLTLELRHQTHKCSLCLQQHRSA
jgi:hypothetical protein